jgi:osmotically-inducible protein OsmY
MATATSSKTDPKLQQDVIEELTFDPQLQVNEIGVIATDGIVTLTGWVDSYLKKWRAEEAAHRVRGVRAVANDIEVRLLSERTDADIAAAAARALTWNAALPADRIQVTVSKGWVKLEGDVEWEYQKQEAENAVRGLWGVRGVSNLISVKPSAAPTDLKKKIEQALVRSARLDAQGITVEIQGTTAILKGSVRSWAERQEAQRIAWLAPGITNVDNRITVLS